MIRLDKKQKFTDKRLFVTIFAVFFVIFLFTSDGHRSTFDEEPPSQMALRIATWTPHPEYVEGESKLHFEYPRFKNNTGSPLCINGILCGSGSVFHSLTETPLVLLNENLNIITESNLFFTLEDYNTEHYVWWRNSIDPSLTFMELFYGPIFVALSAGIFFLICRTFDYSQKISVTLTAMLVFSTIIWSYSQTSLNSIPLLFFILLGFLFIRKFTRDTNFLYLIIASVSLGLAFLSRADAALFIAPLFLYLILYTRKEKIKTRIKTFFAYSIPLTLAYVVYYILPSFRFDYSNLTSELVYVDGILQRVVSTTSINLTNIAEAKAMILPLQNIPILNHLIDFPLYIGGFGMLFSPGVGLLIFCPILFLIFLAFPDFFKRNKPECILFIVFFGCFIYYYGTTNTWHGLVSWGERYLVVIIPFLMIPLGATLEKRKSIVFISILIILCVIGAVVNISNLVQDVNFFIWGWPGYTGLFGIDVPIDGVRHDLNIDPTTLWTFQYSQLTNSLVGLSTFESDILLIKIFSLPWYIFAFSTSLGVVLYLMIIRNLSVIKKNVK